MDRDDVFYSMRLSMYNSQHIKVNSVLRKVDKSICKSKNQFMVDAIEFYIDHFGKENLIPNQNQEEVTYITKDDLEQIKNEFMEQVIAEARREVIHLLATAVVDKETIKKEKYIPRVEEQKVEDDTVMLDLASSWMEESFHELDDKEE